MKKEYSRIQMKRSSLSGVVPTIPANDEIDETWIDTDLMLGELFINLADDMIWMRTEYGIIDITGGGGGGGGTQSLTQTLAYGNETLGKPIIISGTDNIVFQDKVNSAFSTTVTVATLSGNHTQSLQDKSGTIALLSDIPAAGAVQDLSEVLAEGNITGGTDLIISSGDSIKMLNGAHTLTLVPNLMNSNYTVTFPAATGTLALTTDLIPGPPGEKGDKGDQGDPGQDGADGAIGPKGDDGIGIEWLGTFALAPSSPTLNQAYRNSTAKKSYIWDGSNWQIMVEDGAPGTGGGGGAATLEDTLALGNTTGANDIILSDGQGIISENSLSDISFGTGTSNGISLFTAEDLSLGDVAGLDLSDTGLSYIRYSTADNDTYFDIDSGYSGLSFRKMDSSYNTISELEVLSDKILLRLQNSDSDFNNLHMFESGVQLNGRNISIGTADESGGDYIDNLRSGEIVVLGDYSATAITVNSSRTTLPVIIASRDVSVGPVTNSVALGGIGIQMTEDNTAYVQHLNISGKITYNDDIPVSPGKAVEYRISPSVATKVTANATANRTIEFPDASGTLALLSDIPGTSPEFNISINFQSTDDFEYVAPEPFKIVSVDNPDSLSNTITVNGSPYNLGVTINQYDKLKITTNGIGFINLNCETI